MARLPSAITADSPPAVPCGVSLDSSTGSPRVRLVRTTRPSSACVSLIEPGGRLAVGQSTVLMKSGDRRWPRSMSAAATTTLVMPLLLCCVSQREAKTTAARPAIVAISSMERMRRFFISNLTQKFISPTATWCEGR